VRPSAPPVSSSRRARVLIGVVFLTVAAGWAWFALRRTAKSADTTVRVRVVDLAGAPVPGAQVRTRYGGEWFRVDARGEALLESPTVNQGVSDPAAALADALEARATYHAMRHGRHAEVARAPDGTYDATLRLEHCGLFRLGVALTAYAEAHATLDSDPARERWRVVEGNDVVRAGQAATWAVFAGADRLWVTLEGPQGIAQHRLSVPAPGPGFLLEKTLFPGPARPIRGFLTPNAAPGTTAATLAGVLEVEEIAEGGVRIPRAPVRIEADGWFRVEYVGEGRFVLRPRCAFADTPEAVTVRGGDAEVRIDAVPRPWIEVGPAELSRLSPPPVVALFVTGASRDVLPADGVFATDQGLRVAVPGPGVYTLSVATRGTAAAAPRAGEARLSVAGAGAVAAKVALADLPHGHLDVTFDSVPAGGGEVRVLPDRSRTVLAVAGRAQASFPNLPVGQAFVAVHWRDADVARAFAVADVTAGGTSRVNVAPERGGRVEWDATGTAAEDEPRAWALRIPAGTTPYGPAEGTLPLTRRWTGGVLVLATEVALKPGAYRAELHSTASDANARLPVAFDVRAGETTRVHAKAP
jgi:hypothetical protein